MVPHPMNRSLAHKRKTQNPKTTQSTHLFEDRGQDVRLVLGPVNALQLRQPHEVGAHQQPQVFSLSLLTLLVFRRTLLFKFSLPRHEETNKA